MEKLFKSAYEEALENLLTALKDYNRALVEAKKEADMVVMELIGKLGQEQSDLDSMTGDDKTHED